jgi:hypothetical protein
MVRDVSPSERDELPDGEAMAVVRGGPERDTSNSRRKAMIIGITGKKQCGKNTFARFLREFAEEVGAVAGEYSCAALLKATASMIFGVDRELFDGTDEQKNSETHLRWANVAPHLRKAFGDQNVGEFVTVRELMQLYGTEAVRGVDPRAWANALRRKLVEVPDEILGLVTDVRFPEEFETIRDIGGLTVRIYRNVDGGDSAAHASEKALDIYEDSLFDFVVPDDGNRTMDDLREQARIFFYDRLREEPY